MSWIWITLLFAYILLQVQLNGAEAKSGFGSGEQDWGYVEVRNGAKIFWWLYYVNPPVKPKNFDVYRKPLLIWLQGGLGASSSGFGNFGEIGPLDVNLQRRNHTLVNDYNVLFIDSPVTSGFSYVKKNTTIPRNIEAVVVDLMKCMKSFLNHHTEFQTVPTYIIAKSYGGKMATYFALFWKKLQTDKVIEKRLKSNLKGIALGAPWISPVDSILSYAPFLLNTGMINYNSYAKIQRVAKITKSAINAQKWPKAIKQFNNTWITILNSTNNIDLYNLLEKKTPVGKKYTVFSSPVRKNKRNKSFDEKLNLLMNDKVKKQLGLKSRFKVHSLTIKRNLREDFLKPAIHIVDKILNETNLQVFIFSGQLDVVIPTPSTLAWIEKLKWIGIKNWKKAKRMAIAVDNYIEGYVQSYKNFKMFWINRAGHKVPEDNYHATKVMLSMLTNIP